MKFLIAVDCEKNDSVDIRCGGPIFVGYDFVAEGTKEELEAFIRDTLSICKQPVSSVILTPYSSAEAKIWSKEEIEEEIRNSYEPRKYKIEKDEFVKRKRAYINEGR